MTRKAYPSDVSDEEWAFVAPYLTLMDEAAPQRKYPLRDVSNALRYLLRTGATWRMLPTDVPPWPVVYQQTQRWLKAGVVAQMVHDVRMLLRDITDRTPQPRAVIVDSRTLQSTPERGGRAGYDGHKRRNGATVHLAVATLGHLLAVVVTPANEQDRAQVAALAQRMQEIPGDTVEVAVVDQGYTGEQPAADAAAHGSRLAVVTLPTAKRGVVLLPRRWVVERRFAWMTRFRRLVRDDERVAETLAGLHVVAFAILLAHRFVALMVQRS
ncbi:MAG: IS5 family transposase [Chloroflexus sp.]|uniref:IS5 family transposase n=1 Tax=Chloroflexus sp. TaxID=1904827 RepID=UPI0030B26053